MADSNILKKALIKILPEAERSLDASSILTTLQAEDIINDYEYYDIDGERNRIVKARKVFQFVSGKGADIIYKFIDILDAEPGTKHLADKIREKAGITKQDDPIDEAGGENLEPENVLESKPRKLDLLHGVVPKVAAKWKYIGLMLGMDDVLDQIDKDEKTVRDKCFAMFEAWLKGEGNKIITWEEVIKAIEKEGYGDFAVFLKESLENGKDLY